MQKLIHWYTLPTLLYIGLFILICNGKLIAQTKVLKYTHSNTKQYELKEHRGNILTVISSKKAPIPPQANNTVTHYKITPLTTCDYAAFGGTLKERSYSSKAYRYGFQEQETDGEIGQPYSVNYKYRMSNPSLGRFFSIDPLAKDYPHNSPYAFSENRVTDGVELEGLEFFYTAGGTYLGKIGHSTEILVVDDAYIQQKGGVANTKSNIDDIQNGLNAGFEPSIQHFNYLSDYASHRAKPEEYSKLTIPTVLKRMDVARYGDVGDCMKACKNQLAGENLKINWNYYTSAVQMYKSGKQGNTINLDLAYDILNQEIEKGHPIIVGIDYSSKQKSNRLTDNTTDHFVTIVGRGLDENGLYFSFFENAVSGIIDATDPKTNRLYIQKNEMLEGTTTWNKDLQYKVTQVRQNESIK